MAKQTCDNCYNNIHAHGAFMGMDYCMEVKSDDEPQGQTTTECYQNNGKNCPCWQPKMKITRYGGK